MNIYGVGKVLLQNEELIKTNCMLSEFLSSESLFPITSELKKIEDFLKLRLNLLNETVVYKY